MRIRPGSTIFTEARFVEVSTKFSIVWLIASTPCGAAAIPAIRFHAVISSIAFTPSGSTSLYPRFNAVSIAPYSSATSAAYASSLSLIISNVSCSAAIKALASRAIALRLFPPLIVISCQSRSRQLKRNPPRSLTAFARPLLMSSPLWPPIASFTKTSS